MTKPDTKDPVQMEALYRVALHASQLFLDEDGEFGLARAVETALRQEEYKNLPDHTSIHDHHTSADMASLPLCLLICRFFLIEMISQ